MDDFRQITDLTRPPATTPCPGPHRRRGDPRPERATRGDAGLGQPVGAYDVIGALALAASRPRAAAHPGHRLARPAAGGRPARPRPRRGPRRGQRAAGVFLADARLSAAALAGDLEPGPAAARRRQRPRPQRSPKEQS